MRSEGITAPQMAECCQVSYRVIDWWARTGVLEPSVTAARGSGVHRLYSPHDARLGRALGVLARLGAQGPTLRRAADQLAHKIGAWTGHIYVDHRGFVHLAMPEGGAWCLDLAWCERHPCCNQGTLAVA